jgi:hypothetical protein
MKAKSIRSPPFPPPLVTAHKDERPQTRAAMTTTKERKMVARVFIGSSVEVNKESEEDRQQTGVEEDDDGGDDEPRGIGMDSGKADGFPG